MDRIEERKTQETRQPLPIPFDRESVLPEVNLFEEPLPKPGPSGRDIRAAREAAGMTLRDFTERFGSSLRFWSAVETEEPLRRTGRPRGVPREVREQVRQFVAEHLGKEQDRAA